MPLSCITLPASVLSANSHLQQKIEESEQRWTGVNLTIAWPRGPVFSIVTDKHTCLLKICFIIRFKYTLGFAEMFKIILCVNIQIIVFVCFFYTGYSVIKGEEGCHDLQGF